MNGAVLIRTFSLLVCLLAAAAADFFNNFRGHGAEVFPGLIDPSRTSGGRGRSGTSRQGDFYSRNRGRGRNVATTPTPRRSAAGKGREKIHGTGANRKHPQLPPEPPSYAEWLAQQQKLEAADFFDRFRDHSAEIFPDLVRPRRPSGRRGRSDWGKRKGRGGWRRRNKPTTRRRGSRGERERIHGTGSVNRKHPHLPPEPPTYVEWLAQQQKLGTGGAPGIGSGPGTDPFSPGSHVKKYKQYNKNVEKIKLHNQDFVEGMTSFTMNVNKFADMTPEEFIESHGGAFPHLKKREAYLKNGTSFAQRKRRRSREISWPTFYFPAGTYPDSYEFLDWSKTFGTDPNGVRTSCLLPVQDQGNCNASWAFSAAETVAGRWCKKHGEAVRPSAQELIDCDYENQGCSQGGDPYYALEYMYFSGIASDAEYLLSSPMDGQQCKRQSRPRSQVRIIDARLENTEDNMYSYLADGPVITGVNIEALQFYSEGIIDDYSEPNARLSKDIQAYMAVVGYGTDVWYYYGQEWINDWWKLRTSWGTDYGEDGYVRIARRKEVLGIGRDTIVPYVATTIDTAP